MNSSLDSSGHIHTALLGDAVTLVLKHLLTLILDIIDGLALPLVLGAGMLEDDQGFWRKNIS